MHGRKRKHAQSFIRFSRPTTTISAYFGSWWWQCNRYMCISEMSLFIHWSQVKRFTSLKSSQSGESEWSNWGLFTRRVKQSEEPTPWRGVKRSLPLHLFIHLHNSPIFNKTYHFCSILSDIYQNFPHHSKIAVLFAYLWKCYCFNWIFSLIFDEFSWIR